MSRMSVGTIGWVFVAIAGLFALFAPERALAAKFSLFEKMLGAEASEVEELRQKNRILEEELEALKASGIASAAGRRAISAKVYSLYPFADRSMLVIASGANEGVKKESAVLLGNSTLVGKVREVFEHTSIVETVMSDKLKIPVRIGRREVDALYVGGLGPSVELVGEEEIARGEVIVAAARNLPYGLAVGTIAEVRSKTPFAQAAVAVSYDLRRIRDVRVVTD